MFLLTVLLYPLVLALLCGGAGLLVDRASGGVVPAMLLLTTGAAALIAVSQLTTYVAPLAPATPYVLVAVAVGGAIVGWERLRSLARAWRASLWQLSVGPLAYALALAPVLLAGRPSFSSYLALADSAVHMVGADFLIRHGLDFSHLDLTNSYGATIHNYYAESYPSGADTLQGGSSFLAGVPLIWTFQPFTAFMLATATGPAWVLLRGAGMSVETARTRAWVAAAAVTVTLPALVYAYELIGSIKEIVALALILTMGAWVVEHRRWLWSGARGAIPFALLVAGGVSALGVAFGAWALACIPALLAVALFELGSARRRRAEPGQVRAARAPSESGQGRSGRAPSLRSLGSLVGGGVLVLVLGAWPTWTDVSGSVTVAQGIASTSNPGNLHSPLRPSQLFGVWLGGSYKLLPTGLGLTLTWVLVALVLALAVVGLGTVVRTGRYALALWSVPMLLVWLAVRASATTWADAKALMLTSPVLVLLAWAGIAALFGARAVGTRAIAAVLAVAVVGGVFASDALQYNASNLAPTARFDELASIDSRFGGRGPTLFTDFDEYSLYVLRDMDVGGPNFVYPPPSLASAAGGHGRPVRLDRIAPAKLAAYPLIVTRRDPTNERPPATYRLLWQGVYYQVWGRIPGISSRRAVSRGPRKSQLVNVPLRRTVRPAAWKFSGKAIVMRGAGTLSATFVLPHGGTWELWLKGDVMRALTVRVDGRTLGKLGGQLGGNSLVVNALTPLRSTLGAGSHTLTIARPGAGLAPGDGGAASLAAIFLVPAGRP